MMFGWTGPLARLSYVVDKVKLDATNKSFNRSQHTPLYENKQKWERNESMETTFDYQTSVVFRLWLYTQVVSQTSKISCYLGSFHFTLNNSPTFSVFDQSLNVLHRGLTVFASHLSFKAHSQSWFYNALFCKMSLSQKRSVLYWGRWFWQKLKKTPSFL